MPRRTRWPSAAKGTCTTPPPEPGDQSTLTSSRIFFTVSPFWNQESDEDTGSLGLPAHTGVPSVRVPYTRCLPRQPRHSGRGHAGWSQAGESRLLLPGQALPPRHRERCRQARRTAGLRPKGPQLRVAPYLPNDAADLLGGTGKKVTGVGPSAQGDPTRYMDQARQDSRGLPQPLPGQDGAWWQSATPAGAGRVLGLYSPTPAACVGPRGHRFLQAPWAG